MDFTKADVRIAILKQRLALPPKLKKQHDESIIDKARLAIEILKPGVVHIFRTLDNQAEIETSELFKWALDTGIAVYTTVKFDGIWQMVRYETLKNYWPERPASIDIVVVPLIAFDKELNRIGYGGGYYDRLFEEFSRSKRIGLAYGFQYQDRLPLGIHDKALDSIITEAKIHTKNH